MRGGLLGKLVLQGLGNQIKGVVYLFFFFLKAK